MTFNPNSPAKYRGTNKYITFFVTRGRSPTGADYRQPETGNLYSVGTVWQTGKNPTTGTEGDLWMLSKIVANVAYWVKISSGAIPSAGILHVAVDALTAPGVNPVDPTVLGLMTIEGAAVAAHSVPVETRTRALNTFKVEVQYASAVAATDATKSGLAHFNDTEFTVDASGFVSLVGGGAALEQLTGDDTLAVVPTLGNINLVGTVVANATHAKPLFFKRNATSTSGLDVQLALAVAPTPVNSNSVGLASYNNTQFTVDSTSGMVSLSSMSANNLNLGVSYAAGIFTVTGANGSALSATNFATLNFADATNIGRIKQMTVTTPYAFQDAVGTNEIGANLFGITAGKAWAQDCPFYLYAVINSAQTDVAFGISRVPHMTIAPVAGNIAIAGTTAATTQGSLYLMKKNGSNPTVANFDSQPVIALGAFRMQATNTPAWTVQALSSQDGIGLFHENTVFNYPTLQHGATADEAATNTHWITTVGFPRFASNQYTYVLNRDGIAVYDIVYGNLTVNGVNATLMTLTYPHGFSMYVHTMAGVFGNNVPVYNCWGFGTGIGTSVSGGTRYQGSGTMKNNNITGTDASAELSISFTGCLSLA